MNMKHSLRRALALVCCAAMLLPCLPAAHAAMPGDGTAEIDFEGYGSQAALSEEWEQKGDTTVHVPTLSTDRAKSGRYSMLVEDTEENKSVQARVRIPNNSQPAGTELILTLDYFVESTGGKGVVPYVRLYTSSGRQDASTYSVGKWDKLSVIHTTGANNETVFVFAVSNSTTLSKTYYDNVSVKVLDEQLALEYVDYALTVPGYAGLIEGLSTKALSLDGVDSTLAAVYARVLNKARQDKGAMLSRTEVQACIQQGNTGDNNGFDEGFESYDEVAITTGVWQSVGNSPNHPVVTKEVAHSGTKSVVLDDPDTRTGITFRTAPGMVINTAPAGTEYIARGWFKVAEGGPFALRLAVTGSYMDGFTYASKQEWSPVSAIGTTTKDKEDLRVYLISNAANAGKAYFDDVSVQVLTPALALEFVDEKAMAKDLGQLLTGLQTKALSLTQVNSEYAGTYLDCIRQARDQKGAALDKAQVQACVDQVNMQVLAEKITGGVLKVGQTGVISAAVTELPQGVTAQWASVSPADKNITLSGGVAKATQIPASGEESYSATLRLSAGGKSVDVPYTIKLVNTGAYDQEAVRLAAEELRANSLIPVTAAGQVAVPTTKQAGVTVAWSGVKSNPGNRVNISGSSLSVVSVPKGWDYAEAVVTLELTRGSASAQVDFTLIVYDPTFHVLMDLPNPSMEGVDGKLPADWVESTIPTASVYIEAAQGNARTGTGSVRVVDQGDLSSIGARTQRDAVSVKEGYDYVATIWAKGSATSTEADRSGAAIYLEFNTGASLRKTAYNAPAVPINSNTWTQLTIRGEATAPYVNVMGYSYQATISDMYFDDALLWEITQAGILDEIDTILKSRSDADTLYERLGNSTLGISGLTANNKGEYLSRLSEKRAAKGSALSASELSAAVAEINSSVNSEMKALVARLADEVETTQTLTQTGRIQFPVLSDSSATMKWSKVEGTGSGRIRLSGSDAFLDSMPAYGQNNEKATMTLTISKGGASTTVNVTTVIMAYTKNMSDLVAAAQNLDIEQYLNGQKADYVAQDIGSLPTTLPGGITARWAMLDGATGKGSSAMSASGKVTRPGYGQPDATVTLQGTLSKGSEGYEHNWYILVPAISADEARLVVTENVGFEAPAPGQVTQNVTGWNKLLKWKDGPTEVLTDYATVSSLAHTGKQALRIQADGSLAAVRNELVFTAQEGFAYDLQVMVYAEGGTVAPSVKLSFWDNEGATLATSTVTYASVAGGTDVWKNLRVKAVAPVGAVQAVVELNGGTKVGSSWFDDVRLREYPLVANGSFELGREGWTTQGSTSGGKLTLTATQNAVSNTIAARRGVTYFLTVEADGGKAGLRFTDSQGKILAQYDKTLTNGSNTFFAYAPSGTAEVQVVLSGAMTAQKVELVRSVTGSDVTDGSFDLSTLGVGTPWDLVGASVNASAGKQGAGVSVQAGGKATSTIIPIIDGKKYTFSADVKGAGGRLVVGLYTGGTIGSLQKEYPVSSKGEDWNTISYTFDQIPEAAGSSTVEHAYAAITLSGPASFDNVRVICHNDTASNYSMENVNNTAYGTFPYNWSGYGKAATFVANRDGQSTEGVKGLGVALFGLGQGGVRSNLVSGATKGRAYQVSVMAKGSGAQLMAEFWDSDYNKLSSQSVDINSADWKQYTVTAEAPAGSVYVSLSVGGTGTGLVYLDEATIYPAVRSIGDNVQLFLDDWLIAQSSNVKRTFHQGEKLPLMITGGWYPNLFFDEQEQVYKMWYQVSGYALRYSTSKDGVTWTKPTACYDSNGEQSKSGTVFKDVDEKDPNKRYKRIAFNHVQNLTDGSYDLYTSPDGINWTFEAKGLRGQDVVTVAYDPVNNEYITTYKISEPSKNTKRTHSTAVSADLVHWTEGVRMYTVGVQQECGDDYLRIDGYGTGMYPLGDSYVAMNWRFMMDDDDGFGGLMDSVLMFSRDLDEDWQRMLDDSGEQVVGVVRGADGEWDDAQIYTADAPINIGNETWWYYAGWSGDHGKVGVPKTPGISAAKWRLNGFASMDFETDGTLTTQQFTLAGSKVHINAKGALKVELLDKTGAVYATASFSGDSVDSVLAFDKDISALVGQAVSLRFTGSGAQLYTIRLEGTMFSDVATDAWYHRGAHYAVANGIMSGYGGGKFGPNDTLSRAMVVQMLFNKEGQNPVGGSHGFSDVPADQWFNNAVTWGTRKGVMSGYGGGKFGPNDAVTIEQIAVILWNYSGNPAFTASAAQLGEHSGWAANALGWAVEQGLFANMPYNKVTDAATRAQAAQMFTNFLR